MARDLINNLEAKIGSHADIAGWLDSARDLSKLQFLVLRDHTGLVQGVNYKPANPELSDIISNLPRESVIKAGGKVVESKSKIKNHEIQLEYLTPINTPIENIPIDENSSLDNRLDARHIDLRKPRNQLIFQIQTTAEHAMRDFWYKNGFTEIHSPKLVEGASESGAELFTMDYFGQQASLAQSPQFYKQMAMAAGFDRVFEIGPVFRANKSHTSRHDTEFTMVDMEVSWIDDHYDVMDVEQKWLNHVLSAVAAKHGADIKSEFGKDIRVPSVPFPVVTLEEAYNILDHINHSVRREHKGDLDPAGERLLGQYIKEQYDHDFVFVTDYPASARPFYHMRDERGMTKSFDLLWNGLEVTTGAQREHRYDILMDQINEKGVDPGSISSYLNYFKHGVPPHGGLGFGLSRMLMNITGVKNVREVTFVYRGPTRLRP